MHAKTLILYIEDDDQLGALTCRMLEEYGYLVHWAKDGQEGMEKLDKESYRLCIVDIMMPRLDGYSFAERLRGKGIHIPIIFLSARVLPQDIVKGFESGGNDYMRKPFSMEELDARIRNLLLSVASVKTPSADIIPIGKYLFRYTSFELQLDGHSVTLSPRLAQLLYKLVTNEHKMLDKKEVLLEFWGDDNFFNGRSLDVFISKLRKLLSGDEGLQIVNIRSVGYKLLMR